MQQLEHLGVQDNTLVVIYSDHGIDFFEKNSWGQGNTILSDNSYRVPFIVTGPGVPVSKIDSITRSIDIVPTLSELIGVELAWQCDGLSLLSEQSIDRYAYFETGLWLAPPPGMPDSHLDYPNILELLDVPDTRSGKLTIASCYQDRVLHARDRAVIYDGFKLSRIATTPEPDWHFSRLEDGLANSPEDSAANENKLSDKMRSMMQAHLPTELKAEI
jgi:arylsulfatase A-like enzyme